MGKVENVCQKPVVNEALATAICKVFFFLVYKAVNLDSGLPFQLSL